jgi:AraC-like DNA-binding protein/mannose-6-phosphate isomerase-like protein (cupin superfamily)
MQKGADMRPELEYVEHVKEAPLKCQIVSIENSSPHWHYEYEVFFVLRGKVTVTAESAGGSDGGGAFLLRQGDIMLFNPREIHTITQVEKGNLCLFLQWSPGILLEVYDTAFLFSLNTAAGVPQNTGAIEKFRTILAETGLLFHDKPDGYQFAIKSRLYQFISELFSSTSYRVTASGNELSSDEHLQDFDKIKQYIKNHFKEALNIDRLGRDVGMSRAKVFRVLKAAGADSIKNLTNYYRVEYAKNLLGGTALTISYIATESGFESDSSFYRVFKDATGLPPNQYRAKPEKQPSPIGVQGYAAFPISEAIALLRNCTTTVK